MYNIWGIKECMGAGWKDVMDDVVCDVIAMWTRD